MNKKELKTLKKFFKKHNKHNNGTIRMHTTTISGIGMAINVQCIECNKVKVIADVGSW